MPLRGDQQTHFKRRDDKGNAYRLVLLRKTGTNSDRSDRPSMWYEIKAPDGTAIWPIKPDGSEGRWRWGASTYNERVSSVEWVSLDGAWTPYLRQYESSNGTQPPGTIWIGSDVGYNRTAKSEIKAVVPLQSTFATPKPERLLGAR